MSEPIEQPGAGGAEAERQGRADTLTDRLLSRYAKPIGVIDTRHPQQVHARTAGWVAQRFAMLDHWRMRYADNEDQAASTGPAGDDFALPSIVRSASREKTASSPVATQASGAVAPAPLVAPRPSIQISPPAPSPMMRVMRRAKQAPPEASSLNKPAGEAPRENAPPLISAKAGAEIAPAPTEAPTVEQIRRRPGGESDPGVNPDSAMPAGAAVSLAKSVVGAPAPVEASPVMSVRRKVDQFDARPAPSRLPEGDGGAAQPLPLRVDGSSLAASAGGLVQRKTDEPAASLPKGKILASSAGAATTDKPTASLPRGKALHGSAIEAGIQRMLLAPLASFEAGIQRMPLAPSASSAERRGDEIEPESPAGAGLAAAPIQSGRQPEQSAERGVVQTARVSPLPLTATTLQRQAVPEDGGRSIAEIHGHRAGVTTGAVASPRMEKGFEAAKEIPIGSSTTPTKMIWRKGESQSSTYAPPQPARTSTIMPMAPIIARQEEAGTRFAAETITTPVTPASTNKAMDVERIAEQVSRLLARQLEVERDRRGR